MDRPCVATDRANAAGVPAEVVLRSSYGDEFDRVAYTHDVVDSAGRASDSPAITGRIEIALFNLGEKQPELAELDRRLQEHNRLRWKLLEQSMPKRAVLV